MQQVNNCFDKNERIFTLNSVAIRTKISVCAHLPLGCANNPDAKMNMMLNGKYMRRKLVITSIGEAKDNIQSAEGFHDIQGNQTVCSYVCHEEAIHD